MPTIKERLLIKAGSGNLGNNSYTEENNVGSSLSIKDRLLATSEEKPSVLDVIAPAFLHGATIGAYTPENYGKLVQAHPVVAGVSDFLGAAVPITAISMFASPIAGAGARVAMATRTGAAIATKAATSLKTVERAATAGKLARHAVTGGTSGTIYGAAEAMIEGKPASEVATTAVKTGMLWGAMEPAVVGAGIALKGIRGRKADKLVGDKIKKESDAKRSQYIGQFKQAMKDGDMATAQDAKSKLNTLFTTNAASLPEGKTIPIEAPYSSLFESRALVKYDKDFSLGLGEQAPKMNKLGNQLLIETKNNIKESRYRDSLRKNSTFYSIFDTETGNITDAFTNSSISPGAKGIRVVSENGVLRVDTIGSQVSKKELNKHLNSAIIESKNRFFPSEIYRDANLTDEFFKLDIDQAAQAYHELGSHFVGAGNKPQSVITMKGLKELANKKGLVYSQIVKDGSFEFKVTLENHRTELSFPDMHSTHEFLNKYSGSSSYKELIANHEKIVENKLSNVPELVSDKYKIEEVGVVRNYDKFMDWTRTDTVPPEFLAEALTKSFESGSTDIGIIAAYMKPAKLAFQEAERKTKIPVYSQGYLKMEEAMKHETDWILPELKHADEIYKGIPRHRRENIIGAALETKGLISLKNTDYKRFMKTIDYSPELKRLYGDMSEKEFNAAIETRRKFDEYFQFFGVDPEMYLTEYLPKMRKEKVDFSPEIIQGWGMPKEYNIFFKHQRTSALYPRERDPHKLLTAYSRIGAKEKFIEPAHKSFMELLNNNAVPRVTKDLSQQYIEAVRGWKVGTSVAMENSIKNFTNMFNNALKKTGMVGWSESDVERISRNFISYQMSLLYSGALGFRPYAAIRNFFQTSLTTYPKLGAKYTLLGMKDAMKKEYWDEARSAGIILDHYSPVPFGEEMVETSLANISNKGLWAFTKVDNLNRIVAYRGAKRMMENYGNKLMNDMATIAPKTEKVLGKAELAIRQKAIDKRIRKFINQTELDWLDPVVIEKELRPLLESGRITEAAERFGKHMAEDTQWIYRRANSAMWMRGNVGRVFGQFALWPTWYVNYARSLVRGNPINAAKRVARVGAVGATTTLVGQEVFGVDVKNWTLHHPALYSGAPIGSALAASLDMVSGGPYEQAKAARTLKNFAGLHVPGFLAIKDFGKAAEEIYTEDKIKRVLGFKPAE